MRRIAIVTGTRAEFGLLKPLIERIKQHDKLQLQLIVTAMHLSPEFGNTIQEIEDAGYKVDKKIECLLSSDTAVGVIKSMGLAMIGFGEAFDDLQPDIVIILGDRSEMLAAASSAMFANIPIAHIHGGETTEGAYDEGIRHAITKMGYLHFAATEIYRKRIIQLGEDPDRVYNVGAVGLDSINNLKLLSKNQFEVAIDFHLGKRNLLITYHPVTLEKHSPRKQFQVILNALESIDNSTKFIFTHANSDKNGRVINQMIEEFVGKHKERAVAFRSLGQLRYLSALKHIDAVIGNSSSGIVEVPYFGIPTVNIGDRQKGRVRAESVIDAEPESKSIHAAIARALDPSFKDKIKNQKQVYGAGKATEKILEVLLDRPLDNLKKPFYDIKF